MREQPKDERIKTNDDKPHSSGYIFAPVSITVY